MCSEPCAICFWMIRCAPLFNEEKTQKGYSQGVGDHLYNNPGPELASFEIWAL